MKIIFESEQILYTEVSQDLVPDYLAMVNDIEHVDRFIGGSHALYTREQEISWVQKKLANRECVFSMIEKSTSDFIGNVEIMDPDGTGGELGIAVTAGKQNQGFGTQAVQAVCEYGFDCLGLKEIRLRVNPENPRAIHVYEKCGFREYHRTPEHIFMKKLRQPPAGGSPFAESKGDAT